MSEQPTFETPRLVLRPFSMADAPEVQRLAGEFDVARTTLNIPHPYEPGTAENWIASQPGMWASGARMACAIERKEDQRLVGAVGLNFTRDHGRAELGYWIGKPYWGNGYATEAASTLVEYAFQSGLQRVMARHFGGNIASGRVMQKIGMRFEGVMRQHAFRWGEFHDIVVYGIVRGELQ
jgi:RimJ/RimL family protein N-acetyltransferase